MYLFLSLIFSHYLCDFALQNDFIARHKARGSCDFWVHVLTAHSCIQAFGVLLVTHRASLAVAELLAHWSIDFLKCEKKIDLNIDQALHLTCKLIYFILIVKKLV